MTTSFIPTATIVDQYGAPVLSSGQVNDSTYAYTLTPSGLAQTISYVGTTAQVAYVIAGPDSNGYYFKQTISYTGTNITSISAWVKQ
jgi:hypothetical protein